MTKQSQFSITRFGPAPYTILLKLSKLAARIETAGLTLPVRAIWETLKTTDILRREEPGTPQRASPNDRKNAKRSQSRTSNL